MHYFLSLSGIPGSGKSTVASFLSKEISALHISSDLVRREYFGDPSLEALRYQRPLKTAVNKILDDKVELALLKKENCIYDSVQSDPKIKQLHQSLCITHGYTFIFIELLYTHSTLKERILKRKNDPFGSEADLSVLTRFWKERLTRLGLESMTDEFAILQKIKEDFAKQTDELHPAILVWEAKDSVPQITKKGNPPEFIERGLGKYFESFDSIHI